MARLSTEARKVIWITAIVGMFCVWPVWIVTYLEYVKMREAKEEVSRLGVDVFWWQTTYGVKDAF